MANSTIYDAFATRLQQSGIDLPVYYEGVDFNPPDRGQWLEFKHFPNENVKTFKADDGRVLERGFVQVCVYDRIGSGVMPAIRTAEKVSDVYPSGFVLGGVRVSKKPHISKPVIEGDRLFIALTINYHGYGE